ncbi:Dual specificity phosphatase, catalytic domain [Dillenia turbinata]|uniref:Dual specificity phosphatase, catalytic domain n=1 Tax=Dillenia turbinata TaxID=194707 RepID=A0AAN8ZCK9_9MAGN
MVGEKDSAGAWHRRKTYWRSASWSLSRSPSHVPEVEEEKNSADSNCNVVNNSGQSRRFPPPPLTPGSQGNCKARSCLPPLQPLSIARRSLDEWPKASSDDIGEWPNPLTPSGRGDSNKNGERLKLDLSKIQRNPDKDFSGLVKRDKIAFFDKECSKVAEHIYLGGDVVAKDRDILKQNGITHVLNCVGFICPEYFKADFVYRTLWLQDSPSEDITSILYDVFDYFEDVREQCGRVFVHCCQGVSRSTSLVIAYLMWREGQSFDDAFQYVKAARGIADPNMGFACQLLQCQKRVHAFPLSPSSLLRMYRIAPHSPYDPLHLVPKMLNDPSPSALDSRGAFIILVPSAIYVWVGKNCEPIMERDARSAVCQIVRYERVHGSIVMIKEGEEPAYFWDAFTNLLPLMDKSNNGVDVVGSSAKTCPGQRKVDSYNVDFEIFGKATKGGFVPPFASSETEHETRLPVRESSWSMLRRKFASGGMKEFVSAAKVGLSRVYSDSMLIVGSDNIVIKPSQSSGISSSSPSSSVLSSLSSTSSPPYLSPDSITSDSSNSSKYCSESPVTSSPTMSCSQPLSSTFSMFSNLSLLSGKSSPDSIFDGHGNPSNNASSPSPSQSLATPSKRFSLSLAERRGSLSKSLKLPVVDDDTGLTRMSTSFVDRQQDDVSKNSHGSISCELHGVDNDLELKGCVQSECLTRECKLHISSGRVAGVDSEFREVNFVPDFEGLRRSYPMEENQGHSISSGGVESGTVSDTQSQSSMYRWPSLERVAACGGSSLDSEAAFILLTSSTGLDKTKNRILYFWVGRSFNCNKSQILVDCNRDVGDVEQIDWNQAGCDVLTRMGLPEDTTVKDKVVDLVNEVYSLLSCLCLRQSWMDFLLFTSACSHSERGGRVSRRCSVFPQKIKLFHTDHELDLRTKMHEMHSKALLWIINQDEEPVEFLALLSSL